MDGSVGVVVKAYRDSPVEVLRMVECILCYYNSTVLELKRFSDFRNWTHCCRSGIFLGVQF